MTRAACDRNSCVDDAERAKSYRIKPRYCRRCGRELLPDGSYCPQCALPIPPDERYQVEEYEISPKSRSTALILCALLGWLGVHRFYVGKVFTGILWLCTGGLFGIGYVVDIILIATGEFRDVDELPLESWD
jgi:TM2 domain